jgi:hypothetical protein
MVAKKSVNKFSIQGDPVNFFKYLAVFTLCGACISSLAETSVSIQGGNQAVVADDGLGVEIKFDANGQMLSIKSTYFHPVDFPDRRGISKAYIIAEEKAKANIARFQSQLSSSSRLVKEVDDSLSKATRNSSGDGATWSKENTRKVVESLEELTGSTAQAVLKGVRVIERTYNEKNEEVKVVVGINRQSIAGAAQLGEAMRPSGSTGKSGAVSGGQEPYPAQPSERRRAADADKF